jgi:predicted Zn-dependent protease
MPNSTMRVNFRRGDFSAAELAAFQQSIGLWQAVLPKSGIGITLQMGEEIAGNNCTGCIIVKRKADMRGTFAALSLLSTQGDLYSKAVINIKADVHKIELLRMVMTHELGHAFGLDDCPDCDGNTTIMNSVNRHAFGAFAFFAPRNKMTTAPTPCDVARVSAGYEGASRQLSVATTTTKTAAGNVQFIKAQDRNVSRSLSYEPVNGANPVETPMRHHAGRATAQPQRSVKIEQFALMDALALRD